MTNTSEMLRALNKHLRSLSKNPAQSAEYFVTDKICCVRSSERQGWELLKSLYGH